MVLYSPQNMFICAAVIATIAAAKTKANLQCSIIALVMWTRCQTTKISKTEEKVL